MSQTKRKPVAWESPEEWEIEQRMFHAANNHDLPEDIRDLIGELWFQYCSAGSERNLLQGRLARLRRLLDTPLNEDDEAEPEGAPAPGC